MSDCEIIEDDGSPADIKTGDIVTTNGGMLGLGHAGIIEVRGKDIVVIEVMLAPDGSVHVQERDLCDFMDDYEAQNRDVFISRPKKPENVTDAQWPKKLERAVKYVKDKVCTRYPVWKYALDLLFHLPEIWYCSDIVWEAFRREGIELEITLPSWNISDDAETRDFMFLLRGEIFRRFGDRDGERYTRGFELPDRLAEPAAEEACHARPTFENLSDFQGEILSEPDLCDGSLESLVTEQLWQKEITRLSELIDSEIEQLNQELRDI